MQKRMGLTDNFEFLQSSSLGVLGRVSLAPGGRTCMRYEQPLTLMCTSVGGTPGVAANSTVILVFGAGLSAAGLVG